MGEQRRTFPAEFKKNAVELVRSSGRSVAAVAMELGIERGLLDRWRREAKEGETGSEILSIFVDGIENGRSFQILIADFCLSEN
jgi:transposase-like protein